MKTCLFLGYKNKKTKLISAIKNKRWKVVQWGNKRPTLDFKKYDLIISFGYKHLIKKKILGSCKRPLINLHISYLPYNKGSNPNFWSFIKNTPKGISIHEMNEKIDSGNLIYRKKIHFKKNINSFKSTYKILLYELEKLFIKKINIILNKNYKTKKLLDIKSSHVKGDLPKYIKNWDISISQAKRLYKLSKKNIL